MTKLAFLFGIAWSAWGLVFCPCAYAGAAEAGSLIARIKNVKTEGTGNKEAAQAWKELVRLGPGVLPEILKGLNDADPIASNWLRSAVDAIAERTQAEGNKLPAEKLENFVLQTQNTGSARRLAYEWLSRIDPAAPDRLLPKMLNDPGAELRRDAVARAYQSAKQLLEKGDKAGATAALRALFSAARDRDQVDQIAKDLKGLDVQVDVTAHFGFISQWLLIGPFDNTKGIGFDKVYPPEQKVNLAGIHEGKNAKELRWALYRTADPYGMVDLNKAIGS